MDKTAIIMINPVTCYVIFRGITKVKQDITGGFCNFYERGVERGCFLEVLLVSF
jgi:hypothetical protein